MIIMANLQGFDAAQVEPLTSFEPLPAGKYGAVITASELKPTRAGTGSYLQLTFEIFEGPYRGRTLWARLNLDNPNPTAVRIAQGELSSICRAVGVLAPRDSIELHNLPLTIIVRCKRRSDTGENMNEISGYSKHDRPSSASVPTPGTDAPPHSWLRSAAVHPA